MNPKFKLGLYAFLILTAAIFGGLFYSSYKKSNDFSAPTSAAPLTIASPLTEPVDQATNLTNSANGETSEVSNVTILAETIETETNVATPQETVSKNIPVARPPAKGRSTMIGYFAAFLGVAIILGLLIAHDISEYFGNRSVEFMFNDDGDGVKNPEYEEAEQEWANGNHLEAIRMMRDYLIRNPREQYVALRIAEIYEKDLKNQLAAVLEYEEILKHKLPPQRWGWAAIHLCNLYSKLKKNEEAVALLRRIVAEYGETPAAEKARKRLAMFETVGEEGLDGDLPDSIQPPVASKTIKKVELPSDNSNLPPGFRPKK